MPIVRKEDAVTEQGKGTEADARCQTTYLSRAGGLTQFGANLEVLHPGGRSALPHWHAEEDEFVYIIEGSVTLIEGDTETLVSSGASVCFPAGAPLAHCLENRGDADAVYLVVGARSAKECVTYPLHDRVFYRDGAERRFETLDGQPAGNPYHGD